MRTRLALVALAVTAPLALTACGSSSSTKTTSPSTTTAAAAGATSAAPTGGATQASGDTCAPVAGDTLIALADDKQLQSSDNITPVVKTTAVTPALTAVLNSVSTALTQDKLVQLNKAVGNHELPGTLAAAFVKDNNITGSGGSGSIKVVAAGFSESEVLANVYADALKAAGFSSSVQKSTNREAYEKALESGEVQVVPEYAATLTAFLDPTAKTSGDINATIATLTPLAAKRGLTVLKPSVATDENTFAVTTAFATKYAVKSLSDLATKCPGGITLGGPSELQTRPYGAVGLKSTYGLTVSGFTTLDADGPLTRGALKQGRVILGLVFSSDSDITPAAS